MSDGKDHTGLGPLRIPIFIGGTAFAYYEGIKSFGRVLANNPKEIIARANDTLISSHSGFSPNMFNEIVFGTLMMITGVIFTIGDMFMFAHYLGFPKTKVLKEKSE